MAKTLETTTTADCKFASASQPNTFLNTHTHTRSTTWITLEGPMHEEKFAPKNICSLVQESFRSTYAYAPGGPKVRSQFGRSWSNYGPNFVDFGLCRRKVGSRQICRTRPTFGRNWQTSVAVGPSLVEVKSVLAGVD